jgi:hypothetical protein
MDNENSSNELFLGAIHENRRLQGTELQVSDKTFIWMKSLSIMKSNLDNDGRMIDLTRSNTGHLYIDVNGSVAMIIVMNLFLLIFGILFFAYRIYVQGKYFNSKKNADNRKSKYMADGIEVEALDQNS